MLITHPGGSVRPADGDGCGVGHGTMLPAGSRVKHPVWVGPGDAVGVGVHGPGPPGPEMMQPLWDGCGNGDGVAVGHGPGELPAVPTRQPDCDGPGLGFGVAVGHGDAPPAPLEIRQGLCDGPGVGVGVGVGQGTVTPLVLIWQGGGVGLPVIAAAPDSWPDVPAGSAPPLPPPPPQATESVRVARIRPSLRIVSSPPRIATRNGQLPAGKPVGASCTIALRRRSCLPLDDRRNAGSTAQVRCMPTVRCARSCRLATLVLLCAIEVGGAPSAGFAAPQPPAPPADATSADAGSDYGRAQALFRARKFKEAIALLDTYLLAHPRDARALVLRGDCKADLEDNEGALHDYNSAIKIDPEFQYAYVTRCETRLQLDDTAGALSDCDTAVRLDATDALAYEDRADVQFQREAYDLALTDYDKAIELGRSSAYVFAARCDTERLVGKYDRAKADCEKALTVDPKSRRGLWARGRLALAQARYSDGIGDFNAYIAQDPKASDVAYYFRALAYNRIQSYKLALEDLQTYIQRRPTDPDGYKERAIASYSTGDKAGALADLDTALRGYRKDGNTVAADRVTAMTTAIQAGKPPVP